MVKQICHQNEKRLEIYPGKGVMVMKETETVSLLIASIMTFSVFFGRNKTPEDTSSLTSEPTLSASKSQAPPKVSPGSPSSAVSSSPGISSVMSSGLGSKATSLKNIVTNNKKFNKLFVNNPTNKTCLAEMEKVTSIADMIKVNEKYTKLWQTGIDSGYKKLPAKVPGSRKKSHQNRREKWVKGTSDGLKKIIEKAQSARAMAQLEAFGETMEFYRERAAVTYKNLYTHGAKSTYAYSTKK